MFHHIHHRWDSAAGPPGMRQRPYDGFSRRRHRLNPRSPIDSVVFRDADGPLSQDAAKDIDDSRIELRSGASAELRDGVLGAAPFRIRSIVGDRTVGVDDRQDTGPQRDYLSSQSVRIAGAVPTFLMVAH